MDFDYDIADLTSNQNILPQNMVAFVPCDDGRNEMFPMGLRDGGNGELPIDPRHEYVSYEECTAAERARLTNLIEGLELRSSRCCRRRWEAKQIYREFRIKKTRQYKDAHEKYHTNDNFARLEVLKDRKWKRMSTISRRFTRLWARTRRQQTIYSQRLQAVINGIAYRKQHPDRTFVIYIQERDVVLQRTQTLPLRQSKNRENQDRATDQQRPCLGRPKEFSTDTESSGVPATTLTWTKIRCEEIGNLRECVENMTRIRREAELVVHQFSGNSVSI